MKLKKFTSITAVTAAREEEIRAIVALFSRKKSQRSDARECAAPGVVACRIQWRN